MPVLELVFHGQEALLHYRMKGIELKSFISQLEAEFEELEPGTLKAATGFRDLEEWSSMHALIIIALIDTEYDIILSGDDLRSASTVQDLYDIVVEKKGA